MRLTPKFIIMMLIISLLPIAGIAIFSFSQTEKSIKQDLYKDLTVAAELAEGNILSYFQWQKIRGSDWSSDGHIRSEVAALEKNNDPVRAGELSDYIIKNKQILAPDILSTDIIDKSSRIIVSTVADRIGTVVDLPQAFHFSTAKYGQSHMSSIPEMIGSVPEFLIHIPIYSLDTNQDIGAMIIHISENEINNLLQGETLEKLGSQPERIASGNIFGGFNFYLVGRDHLLMTNSDPNVVFKQKVNTLATNSCFDKNEESVAEYINYTGNDVYGAWACPIGQDWVMIVEINKKAADIPIMTLYYEIVIATFMAVLLSGGLGYLFTKGIVGRINNERKIIDLIGRGDLGARAESTGGDEITNIATGINKMAENLSLIKSDLEDSESRFRDLIYSAPVGILVADQDGKILRINDFAVRTLGYEHESELVGHMSVEFYRDVNDRQRLRDTFKRDGHVTDFELQFVRKDKSIIFARLDGVLERVKDGTFNFFVIIQDISRDVANRKSILESESRYRSLTDSSPMCIKIFDRDGKLTFINKIGRSEHHLKDGLEFHDWNYMSSVADEYKDQMARGIRRAFEGESSDLEFKHVPGTGNDWCHIYFAPNYDDQGKINEVIASSIDVTVEHNSADKISKLEQTKTEFVAIAANQLSVPIVDLKKKVEALAASSLNREQADIVNSLLAELKNLVNLMKFLLLTVRPDVAGVKFNLTSIDLKSLTADIIRDFTDIILEKQLRIDIKQEPDPFPFAFMDFQAVRQVIQVLISNAIFYSKNNSSIEIRMKISGFGIEYSVIDHGIGIPVDEQSKIFDKFYRGSNSKQAFPNGIGLGLSLAKSFVESWGGKIWFESELQRGSIFHVTMPIISPREAIRRQ